MTRSRDPSGTAAPPAPTSGSALDGRGGAGDLLRWQAQRLRALLAGETVDRPPPEAFPPGRARMASPRADGEIRVTWVGQATTLIQIGGLNILTDPVWSARASPVSWAGPSRLAPPGVRLEDLPPLDAVLLSHDHYDHLDDATVRRVHARHGDDLLWLAPVGFRPWLRRRGITGVLELGWWEEAVVARGGEGLTVTALPARHWSRRAVLRPEHRFWGSWALRPPGGPGVYFAGDSGYFAGYAEIGARMGPFDVLILPVGAYEPRWFMGAAHMNPEDAVLAYRDLGARGALVGVHWGTFRLTDEDPLEPPLRLRRAWGAAGLPTADLHLPAHGATVVVEAG